MAHQRPREFPCAEGVKGLSVAPALEFGPLPAKRNVLHEKDIFADQVMEDRIVEQQQDYPTVSGPLVVYIHQ